MFLTLLFGVSFCFLSANGADIPDMSALPYKIGSFNIQTFGTSKMTKPEVVRTLVKLINRYDILVVLEIRDASEKAIKELFEFVKSKQRYYGKDYKMVMSDRLGRTVSKEQYAFFYNEKRVRLVDTYQYDDVKDNFEREPFAARFQLAEASVPDVSIIAIHVTPSNVSQELTSLLNVHKAVEKQWRTKNIIIAGDLNADCTYIKPDELDKLTIRKSKKFLWLINRCHATTTVGSVCLYDHFIVSGQELMEKGVVKDSANVFRYDAAWRLQKHLTSNISDHYPVEFLLSGKNQLTDDSELTASNEFSVTQPLTRDHYRAVRNIWIKEYSSIGERANFEITVLKRDTDHYLVIAERKLRKTKDIFSALTDFTKKFPDILKQSTLSGVKAYLDDGYLEREEPPFSVMLSCRSRQKQCQPEYRVKVEYMIKYHLKATITVSKTLVF